MSVTNVDDRQGVLQKFNIPQVQGRGRISAAGKIVKLQLLNLSCDKYHVHTSSNVALAVLRGIERTSLRHQRTKAFVQIVRGQLLLLHDYHLSTYQTRGKYPYSKALVRLLIRYVKLEYDVLYYQENYSAKYEKEVEGKVQRLLHLLVNGIASKFSDDPYDNVVAECVLRILNLSEAEYKTSGRFISALINKLAKKIGLLDVKAENRKFGAPCPTILRSSDEIVNISDCESDDEDNMLAPYPGIRLSPIAPELKTETPVKAEPPPDFDSGQGLERLNIDELWQHDEPPADHQPIAGTSFKTSERRKEDLGPTTGESSNCNSARDSDVIDLITEPLVVIRDVHTKQTIAEKKDKSTNDSTSDKSTNNDSDDVVICEVPAVIGNSSSEGVSNGGGNPGSKKKVTSKRNSPIHTIDLDDDDDDVVILDVSDDDCVIMEEEEDKREDEDEILEKFSDEPRNIRKRAAQVNEISSTTGTSGLIFPNLLCADSPASTSKSKVFLEVDALRELPIVGENSPNQLRQKILETYANILDKNIKENVQNLLDEAPNTEEEVRNNVSQNDVEEPNIHREIDVIQEVIPNTSKSAEEIQPEIDNNENSDSALLNPNNSINKDNNNDAVEQPETPREEISLDNIKNFDNEQTIRLASPEIVEDSAEPHCDAMISNDQIELPNVEDVSSNNISKESKEDTSISTGDESKQNKILEEFQNHEDQETVIPIMTETRSTSSGETKTEVTANPEGESSHHHEENADIAATKLEEILASYGNDEGSNSSVEVESNNAMGCLNTLSEEFEQLLVPATNQKQDEQLERAQGEVTEDSNENSHELCRNEIQQRDGVQAEFSTSVNLDDPNDAAVCRKDIDDNVESKIDNVPRDNEGNHCVDAEDVTISAETDKDADVEKSGEQLGEYEDIFIILPTEENADSSSRLSAGDDEGENFVYIWNENDSSDIEETTNLSEVTEGEICDGTSKTDNSSLGNDKDIKIDDATTEENCRDEVDTNTDRHFDSSGIPTTNTWMDCAQFHCTEDDLSGGVEVQAATPTHDFNGESNEEVVQTHTEDANVSHEVEIIGHTDDTECEMKEIANSSDLHEELICENKNSVETEDTRLELDDVQDKSDFVDQQMENHELKTNEMENSTNKGGDEVENLENEIEEVGGKMIVKLPSISNDVETKIDQDSEGIANSPERIDQIETTPTQLVEDLINKVAEEIDSQELGAKTNEIDDSINSQSQLDDSINSQNQLDDSINSQNQLDDSINSQNQLDYSINSQSQLDEDNLDISAEFEEIENKTDEKCSISVEGGDVQNQSTSNHDGDSENMDNSIKEIAEIDKSDNICNEMNEQYHLSGDSIHEDSCKIEVNSPKIIRDGAQLGEDDKPDRSGFFDEMKASRDDSNEIPDSPDQSLLDHDQGHSGDSFEDAYNESEECTSPDAHGSVPPHLRGIITDDIMECLTINLEMLATTAAARAAVKINQDSKPKRRSRLKMSTRRCKKQAKPSEVCADVPSQPPNAVYSTTAVAELCAGSEDSYDSFAGNLIIAEDVKSSPLRTEPVEESIFDEDTVDEDIVQVKTSSAGSEPPNLGICIEDCVTFQDLYAKGFTRGEFERFPKKDCTSETTATTKDIDELMLSHDGEILNIFGVTIIPQKYNNNDGKKSPADPFSEFEESNDSQIKQPVIRTKAELKAYDKKKPLKKARKITTQKCGKFAYVKLARDTVIEGLINTMNLTTAPMITKARNDKPKKTPPQRRLSLLVEKQTQIDESPLENRKITRSLSVDLLRSEHLDSTNQILPAEEPRKNNNKRSPKNNNRASRKKSRLLEADTYGSELACSEAITKRRSSKDVNLCGRVESVEMHDIESKLSAVGTTIEQININQKQNRKRVAQNQRNVKSAPKRINAIVENLQFEKESVVPDSVEIIPIDSGKSRNNLKKKYRKQRTPRKVPTKGFGRRKRSIVVDNAEKVDATASKKAKLSPEYKEFCLYPEKNISGYKIPKKTQMEMLSGTDVLFVSTDESVTTDVSRDYSIIEDENKKTRLINDTEVYSIPVVELSVRSEQCDSLEQDIEDDMIKFQNVTKDSTSPLNSEDIIIDDSTKLSIQHKDKSDKTRELSTENIQVIVTNLTKSPEKRKDKSIQQNVNVSEFSADNIKEGKISKKSLKEPESKNIGQNIDTFSELSTENIEENLKDSTKSLKEPKKDIDITEVSTKNTKKGGKNLSKSQKGPKDTNIQQDINISELSTENIKENIKGSTKSLEQPKDTNIEQDINISEVQTENTKKDRKSSAKPLKGLKSKSIQQDVELSTEDIKNIKCSSKSIPKDKNIQQNISISEMSTENIKEKRKTSTKSLKEPKSKNIRQSNDKLSELSTENIKEDEGSIKSQKEPEDKNIQQAINIPELTTKNVKENKKSTAKSLKEPKSKNIQQSVDNFSESSAENIEDTKSLTKQQKGPKDKNIRQDINNSPELTTENVTEDKKSSIKSPKESKSQNIEQSVDNFSELSVENIEDIKNSTKAQKGSKDKDIRQDINISELTTENVKEGEKSSTKAPKNKNIQESVDNFSDISTENIEDKKGLTKPQTGSKDKTIPQEISNISELVTVNNKEHKKKTSTKSLRELRSKSIQKNIENFSELSTENMEDIKSLTKPQKEFKDKNIQQDINNISESATDSIKEDKKTSSKSLKELRSKNIQPKIDNLLEFSAENTKEMNNSTKSKKAPTEKNIQQDINISELSTKSGKEEKKISVKSLKEAKSKNIDNFLELSTENIKEHQKGSTKSLKEPKDTNIEQDINISELPIENTKEDRKSSAKSLKQPKSKNFQQDIDNLSESSVKTHKEDANSTTKALVEPKDENIGNFAELPMEIHKEDIKDSTKLLTEPIGKNIETALEQSTDNTEGKVEDSTKVSIESTDKSVQQKMDDLSDLTNENRKDDMRISTEVIEPDVQQHTELATDNLQEDSTKSMVEIKDERLLSKAQQNTEALNLTVQKSKTESENEDITDPLKFPKEDEAKNAHSVEDVGDITKNETLRDQDLSTNPNSTMKTDFSVRNLIASESVFEKSIAKIQQSLKDEKLVGAFTEEIEEAGIQSQSQNNLSPQEVVSKTSEEESIKCNISGKDNVETTIVSKEVKDANVVAASHHHSIEKNITITDDEHAIESNINLSVQKAETTHDNTAEVNNKFRGLQIPPDKKQKLLNRIRNITTTDDKVASNVTHENSFPKNDNHTMPSQESSAEKIIGKNSKKINKSKSERNIFRDVESLAISECKSRIVEGTQSFTSKEGNVISQIQESCGDKTALNVDQRLLNEKQVLAVDEGKVRETSPDVVCLDDVEASKRCYRRKSIIKSKGQSPSEKKYVTFNMERNGYRTYDPEKEPDTYITSRTLFEQEKLYNYAKRLASASIKSTTKKDGVYQQQPRILNLEQFPKDSELCRDMKSLFPSENKQKRKLDEAKAYASKRKRLGKDIRTIVDKLAARPACQLKKDESNEKIEITIIDVIDEDRTQSPIKTTENVCKPPIELFEKESPSKEETNMGGDHHHEILEKPEKSKNIEDVTEFPNKISEVEDSVSGGSKSAESTENALDSNLESLAKEVPDLHLTAPQTEVVCKHNAAIVPTVSSFGTTIQNSTHTPPAWKNPELVVVLERMNIDAALLAAKNDGYFEHQSFKDSEKEVNILPPSNDETNMQQNSKVDQSDNVIMTIPMETKQISSKDDISTIEVVDKSQQDSISQIKEAENVNAGALFTNKIDIEHTAEIVEKISQNQAPEFKKAKSENIWTSLNDTNVEDTAEARNKSPQHPITPEFKQAENENTWACTKTNTIETVNVSDKSAHDASSITSQFKQTENKNAWTSLTVPDNTTGATEIITPDTITSDFKETSDAIVDDSFASIKEEIVETPFNDTNDDRSQSVDLSNVSSDSGNDISNILPSDLSWSGDSFLLSQNFEEEEISTDVPIKTEVLEEVDNKDSHEKVDDAGFETATDHSYSMGGPLVCGELLVEDDITEQLDNSLIANDNKFPLSEHDRILLTQTNLTQQSSPSLNDSPVEDVYLPLSLSESQFSFGNTKDSSPTMSVENMLETMNKQFLTDVDLQDMDHIDFTGASTTNVVNEPKEEVTKKVTERRKSISEEKVRVLRNEYEISSIDINALTAIMDQDVEIGARKSGFKREHSRLEAGKHQQSVSYYHHQQHINHSPPKKVKVVDSSASNQIMTKGETEQQKSRVQTHAATYPVRQNNKTRVTAAVKHPHLKINDSKKATIPPIRNDCKTPSSYKDANIIPKLTDVNRTLRNVSKFSGGFSERRCDSSDFDPNPNRKSRNRSPLSLPRISDSPTTKSRKAFCDEKPRPQTQAEINATFDRLKSEPAENHRIKVVKVADAERYQGSAYRKAKTPDGRLCRGNPGQSNHQHHTNSRGYSRPSGSSSVRIPNESSSTDQKDSKKYEWLKNLDPMMKHLPKQLHIKPLVTFDPVTPASDPKV